MPDRKWRRAEVEARSNKQDATIIIDNVVYDVSEFLEEHPGGSEVLLDNAGQDASRCFHDVGHSDIATEWMRKFVVGELVDEDRREVVSLSAALGSGESSEESSVGDLVNVWAPPVALAALAALLYSYLFL